ncbi:AP-2 complex subunit beta [Nadsonia fulvescens var. elongata DSM 6958]|uniref:AP complex subunit beta n=1 Tax=Nadsonia fulvescens var. elongata DSM 6958 TaxID=857566 RepID=A0A1E3PEE9_9ASCO|nr:AP-2 complex subunit beta [Nadsonia fulvescens var. elongata DSM 6958]
MTMSNNEMIALFNDVVNCVRLDDIDIKKMCFLYLLTYARVKQEAAIQALEIILPDLESPSPLIRALVIKTISSIPIREYIEAAVKPTKKLLQDSDPYVRKTASYCVAKLWSHEPQLVENTGLISSLNRLLDDVNATVVASALASLNDITEKSADLRLTLDKSHASKLIHSLNDCNEWSQVYVLNALMAYLPQTSEEAVSLVGRVMPRLQHSNASVVLNTVKLVLYFCNYVEDVQNSLPTLSNKIGPPLVTLLSKPNEIQYLVLRNCIMLLQSRPELLKIDIKAVFCKYNDPIYIKTTKLEVIYLLANESNISLILKELQEYATEIDVQVVKKAVRAIGKLAIKIESSAPKCIEVLMELISTRISYIVQEAIVVIKNILRRYPGRYEHVISVLCENLESLEESEAKSAMIWIIGHYADRINNSHVLLADFLESFLDETVEVQLTLLTAIIKLFILRPTKGQELVPTVLKLATEETDSPDLRDRGYIYWRLLLSDPKKAKDIVLGELPIINTENEKMDPDMLEELELNIGTLASIYLKPVQQVFRLAKPKYLPDSPALQKRPKKDVLQSTAAQISQASYGQAPLAFTNTTDDFFSGNVANQRVTARQLPFAADAQYSSPLQEQFTQTSTNYNSNLTGQESSPFSSQNMPHISTNLQRKNSMMSFGQAPLHVDGTGTVTNNVNYIVSQNGMQSGGNTQDLLW